MHWVSVLVPNSLVWARKNWISYDFAQAIKDVISGAGLKVDNAEAQTLVQNFFQEQEA